jgi:chemotaxis methyl-accepting protein methylase/Skp family chaperone for outer membrane proteins
MAAPEIAASEMSPSITLTPWKKPALAGPGAEIARPAPDGGESLPLVLRQVSDATGRDFSLYKTSTLRRRIERRMAMHGLVSMADYAKLLASSSQEAELLCRELLIGVTSFFRDPALWSEVDRLVIPALLQGARPRRGLRAWVVGCSTGEEAYTLAMLFREAFEATPGWRQGTVQIFATDLSADAIQRARRGVYPASIAQWVSPARLARFFVHENGGYRVSKQLRDMVLFAQHNVITDAPFARIDLVSCRNLLIYFKTSLQQRVVPLFHYVLRPGGYLLLGNSETVGPMESLCTPLNAKLRIYRSKEARHPDVPLMFPILPPPMPRTTSSAPPPHPEEAPPPISLQSLANRLILEEFSPPSVLVSEEGDILYISGRTGKFLEPAAGQANWNVYAMAREGLRAGLGAALRKARAEGQVTEAQGLAVESGGQALRVDLSVRPVTTAGHRGLMMIVFREMATEAPIQAAPVASSARQSRSRRDTLALQRATEEAQTLREEMRSAQEEMRSAQEELQSANEELQSTNEELQSINEELTTSKEEMQSMNEELQTVNAELRAKLEDLALAQGDLKNLLNSTQIATLFLDSAMNVRRFTEQAKRVINLRDSDVGRPLSDLTTPLDYPTLIEDISQVLRTLEFSEKAAPTTDGRWFTVRVMPYRTQDNVIEGSVITFIDITAAKHLEARLQSTPGALRLADPHPPPFLTLLHWSPPPDPALCPSPTFAKFATCEALLQLILRHFVVVPT